jgi:formamidopyrimidine-DNA glycosylase
MPELPEVETTKEGIKPYLNNATIKSITVRQPKLRWPVPSNKLKKELPNSKIVSVTRRGKYLLVETSVGTLIIHLGMSGSIRVLKSNIEPEKHDHIDLILKSGMMLRYKDPRRFGAWVWSKENPLDHPLLSKLGPEPLTKDFTTKYLFNAAQKTKRPAKTFIMDHHIVVGVGNIYASECLFLANILPTRPASTLSEAECTLLVKYIKQVLKKAIKSGGTTLQDFKQVSGKPGYFQQVLKVYGKQNKPCPNKCNSLIESKIIGQRNSFYCARCQK